MFPDTDRHNGFVEQLGPQGVAILIWILEFLSRDDPIKCSERIYGKVLIGLADRVISDVDSVEGCERKCQGHDEFTCRSAAFYSKARVTLLKTLKTRFSVA